MWLIIGLVLMCLWIAAMVFMFAYMDGPPKSNGDK